jgi:hypothetical protein
MQASSFSELLSADGRFKMSGFFIGLLASNEEKELKTNDDRSLVAPSLTV